MTTATLEPTPATAMHSPHATTIPELDARYVMQTYRRPPVVFVRGEGATLWDSEGRAYLDFLGGIAVVPLGHCHPRVARAIAAQAQTLCHVSNLFHNDLQSRLAETLCRLTGMERAFFCNSGTEANEVAIKIARKWGKQQRGAECYEIVSFTGSFHGRTFASLAATAQPKYQEPFAPMPAGFRYAPYGDVDALRAAVTERTCAAIVEPIQGESGIHVPPAGFLRAVRALCDERNVLLLLDEVQSGMGRTGTFLASQQDGVAGDVVTLAKGLGNGMPIGCCLAQDAAAETLVPGDQGTTFGGQPLACAAALATLETLESEHLMQAAVRTGAYLTAALRRVQAETGKIAEVRGRGLMVGIDLVAPEAKAVAARLLDLGLVVNATGDTTLRLLPPLIVTEAQCDRAVALLGDALAG